MQKTNLLITIFTEEYIEKLFYFCLKKTGNSHEAEDLSSEISLCIFSELRKGTEPLNFPAWVWKIARNRYSKWAERKRRRNESVTGADIDELELADDFLIENEYVRGEDLSLLRRELAFISSDYRDVVVAYYIDDRSIKDIASSLSLPVGTVKSKLFRARKILKEGMDMAREFGKRSYNPEYIGFCASGNQCSGLPFSAVQRKAPVNILCAANNNPCTAEELSMELGIALPYMEEEIGLLVKGELLRKLDDGKYITNFFISPKECQTEIHNICCDYSIKHYETVWKLAGIALEAARPLGVLNGTVGDVDAQMYFAFITEQKLDNDMFEKGIYGKFKRADGGNWGFIGFEQGLKRKLPASFFSNNGSSCENKINSNGFFCEENDFGKRIYPKSGYVPTDLLMVFDALAAADGDITGLSENDKLILERGIKDGFAVKTEDGRVVPKMLIFHGGTIGEIIKIIEAEQEYKNCFEDMKKLTEDVKAVVARYSVPYLKEDFDYYVYMSLSDLRSVQVRLWKDKGLYTGENCQFAGLYF